MRRALLILLLIAATKMSAQDVPTFFPRKFVLEHFTSANCNQCPMGMKYIVDFLDRQTTPFIWLSHHAVYGTDEYTLPESNTLAMNYLGMNTVPSVVFNRSEQRGRMVNKAWDLEVWAAEGIQIEGDTLAEASVVINHHFDAASRRLDVNVSGLVGNADRTAYLLTIIIKENGLVGKQEDAYCSWKSAKWKEYMHPRVVRDVLTATLGDTVLVNNHSYSYSTTYTINETWVPENCCIVAYITPLDRAPIINAEQVPLVAGTTGGEEYGPYGITEGKGPNTSINFDSLKVTNLSNGQLEMMLTSSKTIKTTYFGICKQVAYLYVNTTASVLDPGTYPIYEGEEEGTITAGFRVDEEERFGGSQLLYAVSADLKEGIITPIHMWRMNAGEMILDANGNISLNFTTYNGTNVTATAHYDFSAATTDTQSSIANTTPPTRKLLRDGELLIEKNGQYYTILGYQIRQ